LAVTLFRLIAPWFSSARVAWWTMEFAVPLTAVLLLAGSTTRWTRLRTAIAVAGAVAMASFRYFANGYADGLLGRSSVMTGQ
jgi:hypothetical protein